MTSISCASLLFEFVRSFLAFSIHPSESVRCFKPLIFSCKRCFCFSHGSVGGGSGTNLIMVHSCMNLIVRANKGSIEYWIYFPRSKAPLAWMSSSVRLRAVRPRIWHDEERGFRNAGLSGGRNDSGSGVPALKQYSTLFRINMDNFCSSMSTRNLIFDF